TADQQPLLLSLCIFRRRDGAGTSEDRLFQIELYPKATPLLRRRKIQKEKNKVGACNYKQATPLGFDAISQLYSVVEIMPSRHSQFPVSEAEICGSPIAP